MYTCPYCGTSYATFTSNCKNCGGPLPASPAHLRPADAELAPPPAAPRPISDKYVWKLLLTDGGAVASFVLILLGFIFSTVGIGLTLGVITAFIGLPFLGLGVFLLAGGGLLLYWRYGIKQKVVYVLKHGAATVGQITGVQQNYSVRINHRHPWLIDYQFDCNGQTYPGRVSTLNNPSMALQPGKRSYVLYLPAEPAQNALYPHP